MFWIGVLCAVGGWLLYAATRCVFRVDEGHVALLTSFGRPLSDGTRARVYEPGLRFKLPWHKVHVVPTMEQGLELSHSREGSSAMAADGMVLRFDSNLRFVVERTRLEPFVFALHAPLAHINGVFTCLLRNEIGNCGGGGASEDSYALIRRERNDISARIQAAFEADLTARYGVRFSALDLTDVLPPDELADALNAVMNARAEADAAYSLAEADSQRRVLAAERGVEVARAKALAAEREVEAVAQVLTELHGKKTLEHYVARRRTEVLGQARAVFLRSDA